MRPFADEMDYEAINSTLMFPVSSAEGDELCTAIRVFDSRAFQKVRTFTVHIAVLEADSSGIVIHLAYAQVFIINIDSMQNITHFLFSSLLLRLFVFCLFASCLFACLSDKTVIELYTFSLLFSCHPELH